MFIEQSWLKTTWGCHRHRASGPVRLTKQQIIALMSDGPSGHPEFNLFEDNQDVGPSWTRGLSKDGVAGVPATVRGLKANGTNKLSGSGKMKSTISRKLKRSEGILDVKIQGLFDPVYQKPTWKEHAEKMIRLDFKLKGKLRCAVTLKIYIRGSVRIWRAKCSQEIVLRRKAWRAKVRPFFPDKTRHSIPG